MYYIFLDNPSPPPITPYHHLTLLLSSTITPHSLSLSLSTI